MFSLADAIIDEDVAAVQTILRYGGNVNELDEYGFTPLIEAAIVDNIEISEILIQHGAYTNLQDATGGTPLHWAVENNNEALAELLLKAHADPNAYNYAGQPVMVMPILRYQHKMKKLLRQYGANQTFADDYINTKLLGHMFELTGLGTIIDPRNHYVEVDFEGFYLEMTIGLIADSLDQFQNHFAARRLQKFSGLAHYIVEVMQRASQLIKYQQYRTDRKQYQTEIENLLSEEPILIPVGYEGHAITFVKYSNILVKCDRREESRLYDNIVFYRVKAMKNLTPKFIKHLLYQKQSATFINEELPKILDLVPITELKVTAQVSGNCSWANVETTIPILFFLLLSQLDTKQESLAYYKTLALNYFKKWQEWNKDRALHYCIHSFQTADALRKATKAEILAAILFQRCHLFNAEDKERIELILNVLIKSPYEYLIQNYLKIYYYNSATQQGKQFADLLRHYDYL